jgi:CrcB protein
MPVLLAIAVGGMLGSLARWAVDEAMPVTGPDQWPWATLTVNLAGAFAIGALLSSGRLEGRTPWLRPLVVTGVLGGFTTFSAVALETGVMLDAGRPVAAVGYLGITVTIGLAAVVLGRVLVTRRSRP